MKKYPPKSICRLVRSLKSKKHRDKFHLFIAEGENNFQFLLKSKYKIKYILLDQAFWIEQKNLFDRIGKETELYVCEDKFFNSLSCLKKSKSIISIVEYLNPQKLNNTKDDVTIILDEIKDPGNLGTIIRLCDWYNISELILSQNCVDIYNPKTIQASCGSFTNVQIYKKNILDYLMYNKDRLILGSKTNSKSIHKYEFSKNPIIVIGNETKGISKIISDQIDEFISIPKFGNAESLNAAIATGIVLDNYRRIYN